jgi:aspartyl-tRNA(Asn)/glutamyl-tRNA(Gln) amidotransferase subunit A
VPTDGVFPLSYTLDSVGPLPKTVVDCARADAVMAADEPWTVNPAPLEGLRLGIPLGRPLADLDSTVAVRFASAMDDLRRAGVRPSHEAVPPIDAILPASGIPPLLALHAAETYAIHRERFATRAAEYDPSVRARIEYGRAISAADYIAAMRQRAALVRAMDAWLSDFDGLLLPTIPIVAPTITELSDVDAELAIDAILIRNTVIARHIASLPACRRTARRVDADGS